MAEVALHISHSGAEALLPPDQVEKLCDLARCLLQEHPIDGQIELVFTDDQEIRRLNADYRGRDYATDVLSFALGAPEGLPGEPALNEIYLSMPRARAQAGELGVSLLQEVARLLAHGLLHLAGYEHESEEELHFMERETDRFLLAAGLLRAADTS